MSFKVSLAKFCYFVFSVILILISCFVPLTNDGGYFVLAILSTVTLLLFIVFNGKITGTYFNYSLIFIVILFLFNFGQVILMGFFEELTVNKTIVLKLINYRDVMYSFRYIVIAFECLCLGILLVSWKNRKNLSVPQKENSIYKKERKLAWTIICVTFPIKLFIDAIYLYLSLSAGASVGAAFLSGFPNFIVAYGNMAVIGACLLIVSFSNEPPRQLIALLISAGYFFILMIGGRRSQNVVYVVLLFFLYIKTNKKKINFPRIIGIAILAYFVLVFLYTIVSNRVFVGEQSISGFWDAYFKTLKESDILVETLREYGNTGYTAVCVIAYWLRNYNCTYGLSILKSTTAIFPNIGGIAGRLTQEGNFAIQLQQHKMLSEGYYNIGGSLLGELFFNFDIVGGVIAAFGVGICIGWLNSKIQNKLDHEDYLALSNYVPAMIAVTYWVRDVFGGGIRTIVWGVLFMYFCRKIFVRR